MRLSGLATRTIAATSALALSVVGFVALPGTAQASPPVVTEPTVGIELDWTSGSPYAVITWSGATARSTINGYDIIYGVGAEAWNVAAWDDVVCTEGVLDSTAHTCHATVALSTDTDYSFGVSAIDSALSAVRGYATVHVPASDPNPPTDPDPGNGGDPGNPGDPGAAVLPAAPTTIGAETTATSLALTWSGAVGGDHGLDHYVVAWYLDGEEIGRDVTTDPAYAIPDLTTGTEYEVRVWTVDGADAVSAGYASLTATPATPPDPDPSTSSPDPDPSTSSPDPDPSTSSPADLSPVDDTATVYAGMENLIDIVGNDPGDPQTVTIVDEPVNGHASFVNGRLHYTVDDPEANSDSLTYTDELSDTVATVTIRIDPIIVPDSPTNLAWTLDGDELTVTWDAPTNETTFGLGDSSVGLCTYTGQDCSTIPWQWVEGTSATFTIDPSVSYYAYVYTKDVYRNGFNDDRVLVTPAVGADSSTVLDHGSWPIDALANDDGSPSSAEVVSYPTHGSVSFHDGAFYYTASITGAGSDSFTYRNNVSATVATVTIDIEAAVVPNFSSTVSTTSDVHSVLVEWEPATGVTSALAGYRVYVQPRGGSWSLFTDELDASDTSVDVTGLLADTEYRFYVQAYDESGMYRNRTSLYTWTLSEISQPDAVTDLEAADATTTSVDLRWTEPDSSYPIDCYDVLYAVHGSDDWTTYDCVTGTEVTVDGLDPNTAYDFKVVAWDVTELDEPSADSNVVTRSTGYVEPTDVVGLAADATSTSITLTWTEPEAGSSPVASYLVQYKKSTEETWTDATVEAPASGTELTGLHHSTRYDVRVVVVDGNDHRSAGATTDLFTQVAVVHAVTDVVADNATDTTMDVSWTAAAAGTLPVAGYVVAYLPNVENAQPSFTDTVSGTSTTITGLQPGTDYLFLVIAIDTEDNSAYDSEGIVFGRTTGTQAVPPTTPISVAVNDATDRTLDVSWVASEAGTDAIDHYTVTAHPMSGDHVVQDTTDDATSLTLTGLTPDTYYDITVVAVDTEGRTSEASSSAPGTTSYVRIGAPTSLVRSARTTTAVTVTWGPPTGYSSNPVAQYRVHWFDGTQWVYEPRTDLTEWTFTGLQPGTTYQFRVTAADSEGVLGDDDAYLETSTAAQPNAPVGLQISGTSTSSLQLFWSAPEATSADIDHYRVLYRLSDAESWTDAGTTGGTSYEVTGLDPDTSYDIAVVTVDAEALESERVIVTGSTGAALLPAPTRPHITTPDAIVTGAAATFEVSMVSDDAQVAAGDLADGVAGIEVDGLTVTVTTVHGFSGRFVQPLLVTDGGDPVEVDATVLVNPDPASRATYRIVSATASRVTWTAGAGATGYVVKVGTTPLCTATTTTCLVPRVLGPASVVTVIATGHDDTVGATARAAWASAPVNLGRVHFVGDSPRFTPTSAAQLRALAAQLLAAGVTRVTVHGYTATQGRATRTPVQMRLSAMRANAVAAYLTAYVTAHGRTLRVVKVAEGATHPAASNATAAGRAENRRAEVVLG